MRCTWPLAIGRSLDRLVDRIDVAGRVMLARDKPWGLFCRAVALGPVAACAAQLLTPVELVPASECALGLKPVFKETLRCSEI